MHWDFRPENFSKALRFDDLDEVSLEEIPYKGTDIFVEMAGCVGKMNPQFLREFGNIAGSVK